MEKKVELLAPAGNKEAFYGAVHAGADAVYLGGDRFSARAYADNFTQEEIADCIRYAHIRGRRVYLTLNTLIKQTESDEIVPYLIPLYEAGLDGVIVQDMGVLRQIRENFPDMEIHASTQMTLTSAYGAEYLKKHGVVRVVPARELSLDEMKGIKGKTGLEIEAFIHGAMCYCYSGQCLFSSVLGGRSGNRGRCAQPCRLPYRVEDAGGHPLLPDRETDAGRKNKEYYPLSLKDMCTIEHIHELIEGGIDSFKIEGRMKKAEYAAGVTAIYRKYIDLYYGEKETAGRDIDLKSSDVKPSGVKSPFGVLPEDLKKLSALYIRSERQDGYLFRHNGADMVTLTDPSYGGVDEALTTAIRQKYIEHKPKIAVKILAEVAVGSVLTLHWELPDRNIKAVVTGDVVQPAQKQPLTAENIRNQLGKLGETVFEAQVIDVQMDGNGFYSLKALNELRRKAVNSLEDLLIEQNGFPVRRFYKAALPENPEAETGMKTATAENGVTGGGLHVLISTKEQLDAVMRFLVKAPSGSAWLIPDRVYLEADLTESLEQENLDRLNHVRQAFEESGRRLAFVIALPQIIREADADFLNKLEVLFRDQKLFEGFLVRSLDGLGFADRLKEHLAGGDLGIDPVLYMDAGFYVWNSKALKEIAGDDIMGYCIPYELKAWDQHRLLDATKNIEGICWEKVVYGYLPLMHTANCVVRTMIGCAGKMNYKYGNSRNINYLVDRYHKRFPVVKNCRHCVNTVYNCVPLSLHKEMDAWRQRADLRINFSIETGEETTAILNFFAGGCKGTLPYGEYTLGHEKRGAE